MVAAVVMLLASKSIRKNIGSIFLVCKCGTSNSFYFFLMFFLGECVATQSIIMTATVGDIKLVG